MTFLGMGNLEIVIVLLVAFIFLGPERMVDAARLMGKAVREVRRMAAELPSLDLDESLLEPDEAPVVQRRGDRDQRPTDRSQGSSKSGPDPKNTGSGETSPSSGPPDADEDSPREDTPVAFRPSGPKPASPASDKGPQDRT